MRKFFTLFLALVATIGSFAETISHVQFGDLYYNLNTETNTAEVTSAYYKYSGDIIIPESFSYNDVTYSVTSIGDFAFDHCSNLSSIIIGNSVENIGEAAFQFCSEISSISIPNNVTYIGDYAFCYCTSLTSVTIGKGVQSMNYAFSGCSALTSIVVPDNVITMDGAFKKCSNLSSITIGNNVHSIGEHTFNGCSLLSSIVLPNSVTSIGDYAFENCSGLTSINIPNGVASIGKYAFYECSGLSSIEIPNSVTSIGDHAFQYCSGLSSVTFGNGIKSVGEWAFNNCSNLNVVFGADMTSWCQINFADPEANPLVFAHDLYLNNKRVKDIVIPEGITNIGKYAFYECSSVTSVTIPESVTSIGSGAFCWCSNLYAVYINNLAAWCNIDFASETSNPLFYAHNLFVDKTKLVELVIPDGINSVKKYAFYNCSGLTSITVPNTVKSIGDYAFRDCTGISSINYPNSIQRIGAYAFEGCNHITSIEIPNSVTSIGESAFYRCTALTSAIIGNGITSLEDGTFTACSSLSTLTIGNGLTSMGAVFYDTPLRDFTLYAANPPAGGRDCKLANYNCVLHVPEKSMETYANVYWWEDFREIVPIDFHNPVVTFMDWNGTILSMEEVEEGSAANAPQDPYREGYTFIGWDKDFSVVAEDLVVTAQYEINIYHVEFYNWDETLLKEESVAYQASASAPEVPTREWYTFVGWDKDFTSITGDLVVTALYEEGQTIDYSLFFMNSTDNSEISEDQISIKFPVPPTIPGFTFLKWTIVGGDLVTSIEIQAIYKADETTDTPSEVSVPGNKAQKLIREGNVYILTDDDHTYTLTGQKVR